MTSFTNATTNYPEGADTPIRRVKRAGAPTATTIKNFVLGDEWLDTSTAPNGEWWKLTNLSTGGLTWTRISGNQGLTETLTGNTGGAVPPDTSSNINVLGTGTVSVVGDPVTNTLTVTPTSAGYPITPFVVGPVGKAGYQTIQAALTAANAAGGGFVGVQPGTYTENLTLYDNTQVVSIGIGDSGDVIIVGVHTPPASGTFAFKDVFLQSATHIFNSNAAGTASLFVIDSLVQLTTGYVFNVPNWTSGTLAMFDIGDLSTTNGVVNNTGGASVLLDAVTIGAGTANAMITSGSVTLALVQFNCPISFGTGTIFTADSCMFTKNVTCGGNSTGSFKNSRFSTGSSSALTQSSSAVLTLSQVSINSSNTNAIAGAGAGVITMSGVSFLSSQTIIGTVTTAAKPIRGGNFLTQYVVGTSPDAQYQTIQAAVTAAAALGVNTTIFIKPGTYTENVTLVSGINLAAFDCDALTPNVKIKGKLSFSSAGTVSISGINHETNGDFFLVVSGSAASVVNLTNCFLGCTDHTGISHTVSNTSSLITLDKCEGDISTTGIAMFASTSTGNIYFNYCQMYNTGNSTTPSTCSAGTVNLDYCYMKWGVATSGSGTISADWSTFETSVINTTCVAADGSGTPGFDHTNFNSGTASAITIGAATTLSLLQVTVGSSNTNAISGAGVLVYSNISYNSSIQSNVTTQTALYNDIGKYRARSQPAFYAYLSAQDNNATGDGTIFTVGSGNVYTIVSNQGTGFVNTGTYTAPVTGLYVFFGQVSFTGGSAAVIQETIRIVTTGRTFEKDVNFTWNGTTNIISYSVFAPMTAGDTAILKCSADGTTKTVDIASGDGATWFSGYMAS